MPPRATSTGTQSCSVAAWLAGKDGSTLYQTAYPG